jgi:glycolate oxidase FAD binding subunit
MSAQCTVLSVQSADEVSQAAREHGAISVSGGGTKRGLVAKGDVMLDMRGLSGITEYEPDEYTFTAKAGTTLKEIVETLGGEGQYLPFDPLFIEEGATIGGTVAAAMNGPGRLRYGGVRDFIIGVRFVDGEGRQIRGGGKVVKNAAGFDFPKLMIGSLGRLGVMTELTFKVFPKPEARLTAACEASDLRSAVELVCQIARGPFDAEAVELFPPGKVFVRLAGHQAALKSRLDAMRKALGISLEETHAPPSVTSRMVKVPLVPSVVSVLDARLADVARRYSVACNVAFIERPLDKSLPDLDEVLSSLQLGGIALNEDRIWLGKRTGLGFLRSVKTALDPGNKLGTIE